MPTKHRDVSVGVGEVSDSDKRIRAARNKVVLWEKFCGENATSMANQLLYRLDLSFRNNAEAKYYSLVLRHPIRSQVDVALDSPHANSFLCRVFLIDAGKPVFTNLFSEKQFLIKHIDNMKLSRCIHKRKRFILAVFTYPTDARYLRCVFWIQRRYFLRLARI